MMNLASSFSYKNLSQNGSYMVIAPLGGDAIPLAGSVISGAREEGLSVSVLFLWDDGKDEEKTRNALHVLGVSDEAVHFLHVPVITDEDKRIEFLTEQGKGKRITTKDGRSLSWNQVISLLTDEIMKEKPSVLIAPDFERNPVTAMTSMAFEKTMSRILSANTGYEPLVLKGFINALGKESTEDFPSRQLPSQHPADGAGWNEFTSLPDPSFRWEDRLRLPVPESCRTPDLSKNILYKALKAEGKEQLAKRLIRGDACYWIRRTDNLLFQGKVSGSTGQSAIVKDFQWLNWLGREENHQPLMEDYLWRFRENDKGKNIRVSWKTPQHIEKIRLHGNVEAQNCILEGKIVFSNGYSLELGEFPEGGRELSPDFPPQDDVTWIRFEVEKTRGKAAGISEIEVYAKKDNAPKLIKICVNGDFAYHRNLYSGDKAEITAWESNIEGPLNWYLNGERISLEELNTMAKQEKKDMKIRAESQKDPEIYDTAILHPVGILERWKLYRERKKTEEMLKG